MPEGLQVALIAGVVSLVVSGIGLATSLLVARSQVHQNEEHIRTELTEKLVELRMQHYPDAFTITEGIERRKSRSGSSLAKN